MTMLTTRPDPATPDPLDPDPLEPDDLEPGPTAGGAGAPSARTWRPAARVLWALAVVLLVAAATVAGTLGRSAWQQQRLADDRAAALAAGRAIAVDFVAMRATSFDADTRRVLDAATGAFEKEYASTLAQLKPVVTANRTVSTVERAEAALASGDADSATVLVGVVAPTSNASTPTAEKKTYRLRLGLVKVDDAWKVSTLDFVS
ncbi:hypothetical protein [Terrabacter sp. NPDC000476]|uniref:hypothetical protein n=1 Tax=Terrabacter sp. NPDC000476 TaxID=3154258 RepID=UPI003325A0B1